MLEKVGANSYLLLLVVSDWEKLALIALLSISKFT